ncbi:ATP-binding cassette domain-containing protein [Micrococcus luteus]|nr:ATP-binding cassette domain-containing protein [Micrococcus luteus]
MDASSLPGPRPARPGRGGPCGGHDPPSRGDVMISIQNVSTAFGEHRAVDDVSLEIPTGSIQGIIGFSGAGKSTLLRNVNLLLRPSAGRVVVDGTDLTALSPSGLREARRGIGMVFQHFNLVHNLTAAQNVALALKFAGVDRRARQARAHEALEIVGLADHAGRYPAELSGGQAQRVAIARALSTRPSVLLCDEPTSAVDPRTTATVLQHLVDINRDLGITTVIVTHEMNVIRAVADDVAVMEDGRAVERFALADLERADFAPRTGIGRYLLEDEIALERPPLRGAAGAPDGDRAGSGTTPGTSPGTTSIPGDVREAVVAGV